MDKESQQRVSKSIAIIAQRTQQAVDEFSGIPSEMVIKIFIRGVEAGQLASNEAFGVDF